MPTESHAPVLCPVDFSEVSPHALRHAAVFAACGARPLVAMYANWFEAPPYFTESRLEELQKEFQTSVAQAEQALKDLAGAALPGAAEVETRVVEALPVDAILRTAAETSAGLIVMGTHGRSGMNRWMLGSITERVLRESPIPVLTVRSAPKSEIRRIMSPVSDTAASRQALRAAIRLGACFNAIVTALHVRESESGGEPNLCDWLTEEDRARCTIREVVRHGNAAEEIIALAAEEETDLIVVGAPRRRFFEGMVLGTTTLRAVRHAPCPVLSVPEQVEG